MSELYRFDVDYLGEEQQKHINTLTNEKLTLQAKVEELEAENTRITIKYNANRRATEKLQATITELEADAMVGKNIELRRKVEELSGLLKAASTSFDRITELRWGYDGDCGATNIAELAIDDIQAALKQEDE